MINEIMPKLEWCWIKRCHKFGAKIPRYLNILRFCQLIADCIFQSHPIEFVIFLCDETSGIFMNKKNLQKILGFWYIMIDIYHSIHFLFDLY